MLKMMLKAVGYIGLYFVVMGGLLFAAIMIAEAITGSLDDTTGAIIALSALVVILATSLPYLNFAMKRSLVYRPAPGATPADEAALRDDILAINSYPAPVAASQRGGKLVVTWNYVDGEVWGLLAKSRLKRVYELHVRLDGDSREAILTDVRKSVSWGAAPGSVRFGLGYSRGFLVGVEIGKAWGIRRNRTVGKAWDYKFNPQYIKGPVVNTILEAGWTVRHGMW